MALVGAAGGLIIHLLTDHLYRDDGGLVVWKQAATSLTGVAVLSFLLTVELRRWAWAVAFAIGWGLVLAMVGWFTAQYNQYPTIFEFPFLSGILAVLIAAPLFQTVRDEGTWRFPYARVHRHVWTDAVIGAASLAFTGVTFLLAWLIASLFDVIGIDALKDLLQKDWFNWILAGTAFAGAIGILRERDALAATLQKLVTVVLAVFAPVLAAALAIFLLSIPFTGLGGLWKSGIPATPMLLLSAAGAFVFLNDVIGDGDEDRRPNIWLHRSALLLALCILPLAVLAAISMGQRIGQYGWTPERIWGVLAVGIALAYGAAGWWAVYKGRERFDDPLRPLQTRLAIGLTGLALFLALPILDFGAISANSQLARLQSGKVSHTEFDWAAMAFEFGPSGRKQLARIEKQGPAAQRQLASLALKADNRWDLTEEHIVAGPEPQQLIVVPRDALVPADLRLQLLGGAGGVEGFCSSGGACRVFPQEGGQSFVVFMDGCANLPAAERSDPKRHCTRAPAVFEQVEGKWVNVYERRDKPQPTLSDAEQVASLQRESDAIERGDVKIAPVSQRQLVVGGKPSGNIFE